MLWWMTCRDQWRRRCRWRRREQHQPPAGCFLSPSCPWLAHSFFFFARIKAKCQTFLLASMSANLFLSQLIVVRFIFCFFFFARNKWKNCQYSNWIDWQLGEKRWLIEWSLTAPQSIFICAFRFGEKKLLSFFSRIYYFPLWHAEFNE